MDDLSQFRALAQADDASGPLPAHRRLVQQGVLRPDDSQLLACERLQDLWL